MDCRASIFVDNDGFTTHFHNQRLRDRQERCGRADSKRSTRQTRNIKAHTRECHNGVNRGRNRAIRLRGRQNPGSKRTGQMTDDLPHFPRAHVGKALDQRLDFSVGNGQNHQARCGNYLGFIHDRHAREHHLRTLTLSVRVRDDAGDSMPHGT